VEFVGWPGDLTVLAQVVMIDVALAGDNAVVVGLAVSGLPPHRRRPAILLGLGGATLLRILLGAVALRLLAIIGLTLAGGLLLLWV
jgi:predicted tellurium resistance membrane protein TerC